MAYRIETPPHSARLLVRPPLLVVAARVARGHQVELHPLARAQLAPIACDVGVMYEGMVLPLVVDSNDSVSLFGGEPLHGPGGEPAIGQAIATDSSLFHGVDGKASGDLGQKVVWSFQTSGLKQQQVYKCLTHTKL